MNIEPNDKEFVNMQYHDIFLLDIFLLENMAIILKIYVIQTHMQSFPYCYFKINELKRSSLIELCVFTGKQTANLEDSINTLGSDLIH